MKKDTRELLIARNEIFARHGHIFSNKMLQNYFETKRWYKPKQKISFDMLNSVERYNVLFIKFYEEYKKP